MNNQDYNQIPDFVDDYQRSERERALNAIGESKEPEQKSGNQNNESPGRFIMFFLKNPRVTLLFLLGLLLSGFFGLANLDIEANPEVNQPIALVQTVYPNSSPADVEEQITKPIEEQIAGLSNIKEISSTSGNGLSTVYATFESNADPKEVVDDTREAVSKIANSLPDEAQAPEVIELDFNNVSVVTLSITGPQSKLELTELAEEISNTVESISGVSRVELSGDVTESVKIIVDPVKMEFYNLNLNQITQAIQGSNLNAPLGSIDNNQNEVGVRLLGKIDNLNTLKNTPIQNLSQDGSLNIITLSQVADIELSPNESKTDSFVSSNDGQAQNTITLDVFKTNGGNIVNIVNTIDEEVETLNQELPEGTEIIKTNDNAYFIKSDIRTLSKSGVQTMIIIFFALLVFLTFIEALVAALAIPIIFLATFAAIYFTGQTLNGLTIFSLILSLGLIVDTSIVIVEGIHENRIEGMSPFEAAKNALAKYKWPLIAGTATTIAAFAPMLIVSGVVGDFIKTIPTVLTITLIASLLVSFLITPTMASKLLSNKESKPGLKEQIIHGLKNIYGATLDTLLHSKLIRVFVVLFTTVAFAISISFPFMGILKAQLFPVVDVPFVYINFEAPEGTDLETTKEMAGDIEQELNKLDSVETYVLNLGRNVNLSDSLTQTPIKSNAGHFIVNLKEDTQNRGKSYEITTKLRDDLNNLPTNLTEITVEEIAAGPPTAPPFETRITGPDIDVLKEISAELKSEIEQIEGFVNVSSTFDNDTEELVVNLDQERLSYYQLSNVQVISTLQAFSTGTDIGNVEIKGEEYDLNIYLEDDSTKSINELRNFQINTPQGSVPLSNLGEIKSEKAVQSIPRIDEERSVQVTANVQDNVIAAELLPQAQEALDNLELPSGYSFETGGEDEEIQRSFTELFSSMIIAVISILVILVMIFNSFRQTFIVMSSIPLTIIGIFPGLALFNLPLSFPAFLGVVMLTGIVVNDAIVLMDQINKNREEGMHLKEAIKEGSKSRLIPILLTSITTIFGLIPITLTDEFWRGLGFSVIFGMFAATFLTLIIIPTLYSFFFKDKNGPKHISETA